MFYYMIPVTGHKTCGASTEKPFQIMNGLLISIYAPETVGCAVVDRQGWCAATTSIIVLMNKMSSRIRDLPLIDFGTYACRCGVSCTEEGEAIIWATLARDVAAVIEYKGLGLHEAVDLVIRERLDDSGLAGPITVLRDGEVSCGFNRNEMFQGLAKEDGCVEVVVWG